MLSNLEKMKKFGFSIQTVLFLAFFLNTTLTAETLSKNIITVETDMHTSLITSISADKNSKYFLTSSYDKTLRLWDTKDGRLLKVFRVPPPEDTKLYKTKISPDGNHIAALTSEGVYVFNLDNGEIIKRIDLSGYRIENYYYWFDIYYSENSQNLAIYSLYDQTTKVYSAKNYEFIKKFNGKLFFSPSGDILNFDGRKVIIYDSHLRVKRKIKFPSYPDHVSFSKDGNMIAFGYSSALNEKTHYIKIEIYSAELKKVVTISDKVNQELLHKLFWSSDGKTIYAVYGIVTFKNYSFNKILKIDTSNKKIISTININNFGEVTDLVYLKDNKFAAVTNIPSILIFDKDKTILLKLNQRN